MENTKNSTMYENQNDRQFENSDKGQKEEDLQNWEGTLSQTQSRPDRTEDFDFNYSSSDEYQTGDMVVEGSGRNQLNLEFELNRLHAMPNNNDFSSMNEEEEEDLDEEEELDLDDEEDENEVTNHRLYGDDLTGLRDSQDTRGDDYRNEER